MPFFWIYSTQPCVLDAYTLAERLLGLLGVLSNRLQFSYHDMDVFILSMDLEEPLDSVHPTFDSNGAGVYGADVQSTLVRQKGISLPGSL